MRAGLSIIKTSIKKSHHGPQYVSALCVAESMPSIPDVLSSIPHFPFLILQNSASSRQSIPCPSGTPFFKGERVLRLFQYSAALPFFMRRTSPVEPSEPTEPAEPLSHVIKGQHAQWANPEP